MIIPAQGVRYINLYLSLELRLNIRTPHDQRGCSYHLRLIRGVPECKLSMHDHGDLESVGFLIAHHLLVCVRSA